MGLTADAELFPKIQRVLNRFEDDSRPGPGINLSHIPLIRAEREWRNIWYITYSGRTEEAPLIINYYPFRGIPQDQKIKTVKCINEEDAIGKVFLGSFSCYWTWEPDNKAEIFPNDLGRDNDCNLEELLLKMTLTLDKAKKIPKYFTITEIYAKSKDQLPVKAITDRVLSNPWPYQKWEIERCNFVSLYQVNLFGGKR